MCLLVQSRVVHVYGVHCHGHSSFTSDCDFVYFTVQYYIEYSSTLSIFQAQVVWKQAEKQFNVAGATEKCKVITMETEVKIIERVEQGEKMADIAHSYNMNHSTIGTILKSKL